MNSQLQPIKIFSIAIIAGVLLFGGIAVFMEKTGHVPLAADLDPIVSYTGIVIAAACIALSYLLFKKRSDAASAVRENEKITLYRAAIILQFALLDGAAIFNVLSYVLGGNKQSMVIAACCLTVMLLQFPSEDKYNRFGG